MNEIKRLVNDRVAENSRSPSDMEIANTKAIAEKQWEEHVNNILNETARKNIAIDNQPKSCNPFDVLENPSCLF